MTTFERQGKIEDALSPLVERAKIAALSFQQRAEAFDQQRLPSGVARQQAWTRLLDEGHPTPIQIRKAFRGRGLGSVSYEETRRVLMQMLLRETAEDHREYELLTPVQQLARTVCHWIMEAFLEASWLTEEDADVFSNIAHRITSMGNMAAAILTALKNPSTKEEKK